MTLYNRFAIQDFNLRDYLALERTIMSNERTLLAYLRTGIALLIAGITGTHFFTKESLLLIASVTACVSGGIVVMCGIWRFVIIRKRLNLASPAATADVTAQHVSESGSDQK